jgi:hypothetical protein
MNLELKVVGKIILKAAPLDVIDRVLRQGGIVFVYEDFGFESIGDWRWQMEILNDGYCLLGSSPSDEIQCFGWGGVPFDNLIAFLQREGWTE